MKATTDSTRQLVERYDREAAAYRELWAPILRVAALELLPALRDGSVVRVLDVGTGVGSLLADLREAFPGAHVLGVDHSRGMLAHVPRPFDRAVMDARRLGFPDGSMDRVVMFFMLFHLPDPAIGLHEVRRVLCSGGRVGVITWGSELESAATRVWTQCLDEQGADQADPATVSRHDRVDTVEKMKNFLVEAGFEDIDCWAGELEQRIEIEQLIQLRTSLGSMKPRFDSLPPAAQAACLTQARHRLEGMPSESFAARATLIYSVAQA